MSAERLSVSVVVPTYRRPTELAQCLCSIAVQTRLPVDVIVVDDDALDAAPFESIFDGLPVRFIYLRKRDGRGAARSRNLGAARASGDVLVFVDDDTELDPAYIEGFLTILEADHEHTIGGLSGAPTRFRHGVELPPRPPLTWSLFLERLFLIESYPGGRVLPSGSRSAMNDPGALTPVEFLQGCNMAVRRAAFEEVGFEESLDGTGGGYPLGEDVVFSYVVGKKYRLYSTNRARLKHFAAPGNRPDKRTMNYMRVVHQYYFMHDVMKGGLWNHVAFGWSMIGFVLIHLFVFLRRPGRRRWQNFMGVLSGIGHVVHMSGRRAS